MNLHPWSHPTSAGFTMRGWHSTPSGKPLLHFIHGNGFCSLAYEPMLALLATDFDLWLSDTQGHGESEQNGRFHGWNRSATLAAEAFDAGRSIFGDAPRLAAGHSFGGVLTSFMMAAQPGLFQRAVLLDPVLFSPTMLTTMALTSWTGIFNHPLAARTRKRRPHWPDRNAAHADLQGRGIFKGWDDAALWSYLNHALKDVKDGVELKCSPNHEAAIYDSYPKRLWSALGKVRTPTLMLHGQATYPFVTQAAARWRAMNTAVSEQQVAGGHCFMQEFPADSAKRVKEFLLQSA